MQVINVLVNTLHNAISDLISKF